MKNSNKTCKFAQKFFIIILRLEEKHKKVKFTLMLVLFTSFIFIFGVARSYQ